MGNTRRLPELNHVAGCVAQALTVEGGYLFVTEAGWFLHFASGARLQGYDAAAMKARCTEAGLPVIDCSRVCFTGRLRSCLDWPYVAVGNPPAGHCWPFIPLPLAEASAIYKAEGAEVINMPQRTMPPA